MFLCYLSNNSRAKKLSELLGAEPWQLFAGSCGASISRYYCIGKCFNVAQQYEDSNLDCSELIGLIFLQIRYSFLISDWTFGPLCVLNLFVKSIISEEPRRSWFQLRWLLQQPHLLLWAPNLQQILLLIPPLPPTVLSRLRKKNVIILTVCLLPTSCIAWPSFINNFRYVCHDCDSSADFYAAA